MQMEAFLWLFLPVFVAGGSALLSYYIMQARMEVALAKERETLAEARAMLSSHKITLEERVKATEEACKRQALDDFMHDIRVEERSYVREMKSLNALRKTMVMQERIFFRNIPLSNWIEREMIIEDGQDLNQLPVAPVFTAAALPTTSLSTPTMMSSSISQLSTSLHAAETPLAIARLLDEVRQTHDDRPEVHANEVRANEVRPNDVREAAKASVLLTQHATAFGAQ
jgi:hypothetical protein